MNRSQSELVGVVLVFGFVILATVAISAAGVIAISETQAEFDSEYDRQVMVEFADRAERVALYRSGVNEVEFPNEPHSTHEEGQMRVEVTNLTEDTTETLVDETLGTVEYGGYAYQGGGVFTDDEVIVTPTFGFGSTLSVPVITVGADGSGNTATVENVGSDQVSEEPFPTTDKAEITVESTYYEQWGEFFESRTSPGQVSYDHGDESVTVVLFGGYEPLGDSNVAVGSVAGNVIFGGTDSRADSYDSREGSYDDTRTDDRGDFVVSGTFTMEGGATIEGDVTADVFECDGGASELDGLVSYASSYQSDPDDCHEGPKEQIDSDEIPELESVSHLVNVVVGTLEGSEGVEAGDTLSGSSGQVGAYYEEELALEDETLTVDTTNAPVQLGVESLTMTGDATIQVVGDNRFDLLVNGSTFTMENDGGAAPKIVTDGEVERGTQVWIYGTDELDAKIDDDQGSGEDITIHGVVYAPSDGAEVTIEGANIYGSVIAGDVNIEDGRDTKIHYDRALDGTDPVTDATFGVGFLDVSVNELRLD